MRKLASVQIIKDLLPAENSDNLLIAKILGWDVVVSRNDNYEIGEKVVFFEIDSFLPCIDEFEFLRKSCYKNSLILGEGLRLKSIRLRGNLSQGLIMKLETFFNQDEINDLKEDDDLTERLNIKKWEEPEPAVLGGNVAGRRPDFIKKTDENRIQRFPGLLEEFYNCPEVYGSVKIDGSSHSIGINKDNEFHATSHNMDLKLDDVKQGSFVDFCKKHDLENKLREIKEKKKLEEIVIQGEYAGPGIQKNKLGLLQPNWYIFTADYNGKRVSLSELRELHHLLSVDIVPIVEILTGAAFKEKYPDEESILKRVEGNDSGLYKDGQQEGIVFRPTEPTYSKILKTDLSMKVINNEYLLKE